MIRTATHAATAALAAALLLAAASSAPAAVMISDDGEAKLRDNTTGVLGAEFTVAGNQHLSVSALGIWDDGDDDVANSGGQPQETDGTPDGLAVDHEIGIWTPGGSTPLAQVTATAGTGGTLIGEFRYFDLSSNITLTAGSSYIIGAAYENGTADLWHDDSATGLATSAEITLVEGKYYNDNTNFEKPNKSGDADGAYAGPSFQYTVIPEPASLTLLAPAGLLALRRRNA